MQFSSIDRRQLIRLAGGALALGGVALVEACASAPNAPTNTAPTSAQPSAAAGLISVRNC